MTHRIKQSHCINRFSFIIQHTHFHPNSLNILFIFFTVFFIFFIFYFRLSPQKNIKPSQQWPAHTNPTQTQRKPLHPRSRNPNLAKLGTHILENLGKPMNTMKNALNAKNILGRHKGRLSMNKHWPRGKGRRRFISARSPLPKDRE